MLSHILFASVVRRCTEAASNCSIRWMEERQRIYAWAMSHSKLFWLVTLILCLMVAMTHDATAALFQASINHTRGGFHSNDTRPETNPLGEESPARPICYDAAVSTNCSAIIVATNTGEPGWVNEYFPHIPHYAVPAENNLGNEASSYSKWIIDNYDKLPPSMIFVHGHRTSWHTTPGSDIVPLIQSVRIGVRPYVSFATEKFVTIPRFDKPDTKYIAEGWREIFHNVSVPSNLSHWCCAQFAVTAAAVRRHPRALYEHIFHWLQTTAMPVFYSSRVLEHTWHVIFGLESDARPHDQLVCEVFNCTLFPQLFAQHINASKHR
jgi:hypothetical protein